MKNFRIIPRLDIKNGLLIKGINLEGLRILGISRFCKKILFRWGRRDLLYRYCSSLYGTKNITKFIKKLLNQILYL